MRCAMRVGELASVRTGKDSRTLWLLAAKRDPKLLDKNSDELIKQLINFLSKFFCFFSVLLLLPRASFLVAVPDPCGWLSPAQKTELLLAG